MGLKLELLHGSDRPALVYGAGAKSEAGREKQTNGFQNANGLLIVRFLLNVGRLARAALIDHCSLQVIDAVTRAREYEI